MEHRDQAILRKILSEIEIAQQMLADTTQDAFYADEIRKRAVCMTVINIGELVKNLSEALRLSSPEIPWKAIAGFRAIAAHKYQTLRMDDVYETVHADFPALHEKIRHLLEQE